MLIRSLAAALAIAGLTPSADAEVLTKTAGGPGGDEFHIRCPSGSWGQTYLHGLKARMGALMDFVEPVCAIVDPKSPDGPVRFVRTLPDVAAPGGAGGRGGVGFFMTSCETLHQVVTEIHVETMSYLERGDYKSFVSDAIVECRRMEPPWDSGDRGNGMRTGAGSDKARYGWVGLLKCPQGQWAVGIHGRAGRYVDRLGLICDARYEPPALPPSAVTLPEVDRDVIIQDGSGGLFEEGINENALGGN